MNQQKSQKGQFFTTRADYILNNLNELLPTMKNIIEPFAGNRDLVKWIISKYTATAAATITCYDIDPKDPSIIKRDTLTNPPDYSNAYIITNPPFLARNKSAKKDLYDLYNTNDLYKCFMKNISTTNTCQGGILIIPAGFFFSPRKVDTQCRSAFMSRYKVLKVRYFEETVFDDTTTTVVALVFEYSPKELVEQTVLWELVRQGKIQKTAEFALSEQNSWIIGGEIYSLPNSGKISRHVKGRPLLPDEQQLNITLNALDSGSTERINCSYKKDYIYEAKESSRTYATLRIRGHKLSEAQQIELCRRFNEFLEKKREETWSLFLPQFREYARKRIPFELAYAILEHLVVDL